MLFNFVQQEVQKKRQQEEQAQKAQAAIAGGVSDEEAEKKRRQAEADSNAAAFQELYELTQRKVLKKLGQFAERLMPNTAHMPNLFCLDITRKSDTLGTTTHDGK